MSRFRSVSEPSIIRYAARGTVSVASPDAERRPERKPGRSTLGSPKAPRRMTFTGAIGAICMFPLRAIIAACVALRIHPNVLTFVGVVINVAAAWALGFGAFLLAGALTIC